MEAGPIRSPKNEEARSTLPEELRSVYDDLVCDYRFSAQQHYGTVLVSYWIIADLVSGGWRPSEVPGASRDRSKTSGTP